MYCKKCGKELKENELFCSACGAPVPAATERETEAAAERGAFKVSPLTEEFIWNIHTFPGSTPKKTEDIDFDWGSDKDFPKIFEEEPTEPEKISAFTEIETDSKSEKPDLVEIDWSSADLTGKESLLEKETEQKPVETKKTEESAAELQQEKPIPVPEAAVWKFKNNSDEDSVVTEAARKQAEKIDKFYTFNQKNEEFQKLLDREYEKIKNGNVLEEEQNSAEEAVKEKFVGGRPIIEDELDELFAKHGLKTEVPRSTYQPELKPDPEFEAKLRLIQEQEEQKQQEKEALEEQEQETSAEQETFREQEAEHTPQKETEGNQGIAQAVGMAAAASLIQTNEEGAEPKEEQTPPASETAAPQTAEKDDKREEVQQVDTETAAAASLQSEEDRLAAQEALAEEEAEEEMENIEEKAYDTAENVDASLREEAAPKKDDFDLKFKTLPTIVPLEEVFAEEMAQAAEATPKEPAPQEEPTPQEKAQPKVAEQQEAAEAEVADTREDVGMFQEKTTSGEPLQQEPKEAGAETPETQATATAEAAAVETEAPKVEEAAPEAAATGATAMGATEAAKVAEAYKEDLRNEEELSRIQIEAQNHIEEMHRARESFFGQIFEDDEEAEDVMAGEEMSGAVIEEVQEETIEFDWDAATKVIDKEAIKEALAEADAQAHAEAAEFGDDVADADQSQAEGEIGEEEAAEDAMPCEEEREKKDGQQERSKEDQNNKIQADQSQTVDGNGDSNSDHDYDDGQANEEESSEGESGKGRLVLKVLLIILVVLLVLELAIIGIKIFAAGSAAAEWIEGWTMKAVNWFNGLFT